MRLTNKKNKRIVEILISCVIFQCDVYITWFKFWMTKKYCDPKSHGNPLFYDFFLSTQSWKTSQGNPPSTCQISTKQGHSVSYKEIQYHVCFDGKKCVIFLLISLYGFSFKLSQLVILIRIFNVILQTEVPYEDLQLSCVVYIIFGFDG